MSRLNTPDQFKTRPALIAMALAGLVLAYFLATRAMDTASWWQYFGTILMLTLSIRLLARAKRTKDHGKE